MTLFWIIASLMVVIALAMVVPVLWREKSETVEMDRNNQNVAIARERLAELEREYREGIIGEAEFETAKQELERMLLDDLQSFSAEQVPPPVHYSGRRAAMGVLFFVPLLTGLLYWQLGSLQYIGNTTAAGSKTNSHPGQAQGELSSMDEMVQRLAERLQREPEDAEGWFTLGRTYMSMQRYSESAAALERVHALVGEHPAVLLALADALAMANAGRISGRPAELVYKALELAPDNVTALWLAGVAAEQAGEYRQAIGYWRKLEPSLIEQPQSLLEIHQLIANAEKQLGVTPDSAGAQKSGEQTESAQASLVVEVKLDAALVEQVAVGDTLFIYAKAEDGPPMPLAVVRKQAAEWPQRVTLNDTMAMTPQMKLSAFDRVQIGARISRSGNATAQSGDLVGEVGAVAVDRAEPVTVIINRRQP
jgi:cytochrome c-type biogenesis protein CcmH